MRFKQAFVLATLTLGLSVGASHASVVVNINQVGDDVIATGGGSINLFGLSRYGTYSNDLGVRGTDPYFGAGTQYNDLVSYYPISGPLNIGPGTDVVAPTVSTGDDFAIYGNDAVFLSPDYASGDLLTFSETFSGQTIASLGLKAGTYTYTFTPAVEVDFRSFAAVDPNTVTINIGGVPTVPLPASAPMFGAALLALGAVGYGLKRKKAAAAA